MPTVLSPTEKVQKPLQAGRSSHSALKEEPKKPERKPMFDPDSYLGQKVEHPWRYLLAAIIGLSMLVYFDL